MLYRETPLEKIAKYIIYMLLIVLGFVTVYPFIYFIVLSFNDGVDAVRGGIYFWPRQFTLDNYREAFQNPNIINSFKVTIFITIVGTTITVFANAMVGYALVVKDLPGRSAIIFFFYFTTLFSGGMIPFYVLMKELHILNTIWVYIVPSIFNFFNIVVFRTFFEGLPSGLAEAARIDGCGDGRIFLNIYLPLSKSVLATIALFQGVGFWNNWATGAFYITDDSLKSAATILMEILNEASFETSQATNEQMLQSMEQQASATTPESLRMTFVVLITMPIVFVYPFLQKYFVKGVMIGAIKS